MHALIGADTRPAAATDLIGTWELVSVRRTAIDTGRTVDQFGPTPRGYLTYGADGRMMVMFVDSRRPPPNSLAATDAERAELHRSMCAYAGTYALEGRKVLHRISVSWNELWSGTEEVRNIRIDDEDRLLVWTDPKPSITDGSMGVAVLTWRRPSPSM
jgi:hypothetical protein